MLGLKKGIGCSIVFWSNTDTWRITFCILQLIRLLCTWNFYIVPHDINVHKMPIHHWNKVSRERIICLNLLMNINSEFTVLLFLSFSASTCDIVHQNLSSSKFNHFLKVLRIVRCEICWSQLAQPVFFSGLQVIVCWIH